VEQYKSLGLTEEAKRYMEIIDKDHQRMIREAEQKQERSQGRLKDAAATRELVPTEVRIGAVDCTADSPLVAAAAAAPPPPAVETIDEEVDSNSQEQDSTAEDQRKFYDRLQQNQYFDPLQEIPDSNDDSSDTEEEEDVKQKASV
jgi:hypothetical protein